MGESQGLLVQSVRWDSSHGKCSRPGSTTVDGPPYSDLKEVVTFLRPFSMNLDKF